MSSVVELLCSRRAPQVAVLALMSIGFAGCSSDMQTRLSQNPFQDSPPPRSQSNQFGWQRETTGSVPRAESRELPQYQRPQYQPQAQYQSMPLPPPISAPQSYPVGAASAPVSGGGRGLGSYSPPAQPMIQAPAGPAPRSVAAAPAPIVVTNGLSRDGGTKIIVGTSDTLDGLARRYNVSSAAILKANGYKGPRALSPGQSLVIPRQSTSASAPVLSAPATRPAMVASAAPAGTHVVNSGETLMSISRRTRVPLSELARANGLTTDTKLKVGARIVVPGTRGAAVAAAPVAAPVLQPVAQRVVAAAPVPQRMAAVEPVQKARLAVATTTPEEVAAPPTATKAAEATGALPTFRWPVRGRVITSYGAKTNGKSNDGINVAVPEGTPVKAAEDGVVAYSGSELKGYGNLVLIRHSNGYVTAYAHASELMVKRGETIKRGQVIAKSGQTGEVGSPQLHFEIRKGSSPVDPQQFLAGG